MIFSDGFESGDTTRWTNTTFTGSGDVPVVLDAGALPFPPRKGTYACYLHVAVAGGNSILEKTLPAPKTTCHCRAYINFVTLPSDDLGLQWNYLINFRTTPLPEFLVGVVNTGGVGAGIYKWAVYNDNTSTWYYSNEVTLFTGVWYCVELETVIDSVAGVLNVTVDNIPVISQGGLDTGTDPITELWLRANPSSGFITPETGVEIEMDDVVIADEYIGMEQAWFGMTGNMTWK